MLPFVHIDPRRSESFDLMRKCIESWDFCGIKIYPNIGYFPYDEALNKMYEYCQQYHLPVISHCSPLNPVYFKGSYQELYALLKKSKTPVDIQNKNKRALCAYFSFPLNWEYVMTQFPELKICLAHFGSAEQWQIYLNEPETANNWYALVRDMLKKWPQLFADISFTLYNRDLFPLLKLLLHHPVLQQKILFGSDYYMVESEATERRFGIDLRAYLGEDFFKYIAHNNPRRFISKG